MMLVKTYGEDYIDPAPALGDRVFFKKNGNVRRWRDGDRGDGGIIKELGYGLLIETKQFIDRRIPDRQLAKKNQEISRLQTALQRMTATIHHPSKIQHYEDRITDLNRRIWQLDFTLQHYKDKITELQKQIAEKDTEIAGLVRKRQTVTKVHSESNDVLSGLPGCAVGHTPIYHATVGVDGKVDAMGWKPVHHGPSYLQSSLERVDANRAASARVKALLDPVRKAAMRRKRRWWKPWTWRWR